MNALLTFDLFLVLTIIGLLIITVTCAVLERPSAAFGRYYQQHQNRYQSRQTLETVEEADPLFYHSSNSNEPIQL